MMITRSGAFAKRGPQAAAGGTQQSCTFVHNLQPVDEEHEPSDGGAGEILLVESSQNEG